MTAYRVRRLLVLLRHSRNVMEIRKYSVEPLQVPLHDDFEKVYPKKIESIANEISKLTILEVADLNELLKKKLNIQDVPMMTMGAMAGVVPSQKQDVEEAEEAITTRVQTNFSLKIVKFDETKKVPLIKQVKSIMDGMNLVQAKKFIEELPAVVRTDASKDEVDKLQEELKVAGAECIVE